MMKYYLWLLMFLTRFICCGSSQMVAERKQHYVWIWQMCVNATVFATDELEKSTKQFTVWWTSSKTLLFETSLPGEKPLRSIIKVCYTSRWDYIYTQITDAFIQSDLRFTSPCTHSHTDHARRHRCFAQGQLDTPRQEEPGIELATFWVKSTRLCTLEDWKTTEWNREHWNVKMSTWKVTWARAKPNRTHLGC